MTLGPIVAPGLTVLFVGINPSLRSAEVGHHFARPGNRFWPALHAAGFTPRRLAPEEDGLLPSFGVGVTNVAARPTRAAADLDDEEPEPRAEPSKKRRRDEEESGSDADDADGYYDLVKRKSKEKKERKKAEHDTAVAMAK